MAALIFLVRRRSLVVHDNCQLMFHIYSGIFAGKGNEHQAEVAAVGNWFEKVMSRLCSPFLSETEIASILKGADVWMDSDEIQRRLMRMERARKANSRQEKGKNRHRPAGDPALNRLLVGANLFPHAPR